MSLSSCEVSLWVLDERVVGERVVGERQSRDWQNGIAFFGDLSAR